MSEKSASNQVERYVNSTDLLKLNTASTSENPVGAAGNSLPQEEVTNVTPILKAKTVPVEVNNQKTLFSFKIEEVITSLQELDNHYEDVIFAVEKEHSHGMKPSPKDSAEYLIYKKKLTQIINDYFNYLEPLKKKNTFNYDSSDPQALSLKSGQRLYYDFYRIANEAGIVTIHNPSDFDPEEVSHQIRDYIKAIDKKQLYLRYTLCCIYAVSLTMIKGNYSASPDKKLKDILNSINQH